MSRPESIKLPRRVLTALDLKASAVLALERTADLFPSMVALRAAAQSDDYLDGLGRRVERGLRVEAVSPALVPKFGGGTRPATDLAVDLRILWDALAARARHLVAPDLVNWSLEAGERDEAEQHLASGEHEFVVVTDVVSCYEYIDRPTLLEELNDLTGDEDLATGLGTLAAIATSDRKGIPQGLRSSRVYGDIYLSIADRELARRGTPVIRWVDDYRLAESSLRDARRTLTALEAALRRINLVVNSAKTWTPDRATYADWVARHDAQKTQLAQTVERIKQRRRADYDAEEAEGADAPPPTVDPILESGFVESVDDEANWLSSPEGYAASRRIGVSLWELGRTGSVAPLERLPTLLYRFPQLTKEIAGYLRRRVTAGHEEDTIAQVTETLVQRDFIYSWQLGWLIHALIPGQEPLPEGAIAVAHDVLKSSDAPGFARGRAAIALATQGFLPGATDLAAIYSEVPVATRPDLVAAAALMPTTSETSNFIESVRRDPLLREVADLATKLDLSAL